MIPHTKAMIALGITLIGLSGCTANPYDRGGHPSGYSRADVDRDYMEYEYKARLANEQHFYLQPEFSFSIRLRPPEPRRPRARTARDLDHQRDARYLSGS